MAMKYTKWLILENLPNGHKIYQMVNIISNLPLNIPNGIYLTLSNMDENGHKIYQMATQIYQMAKKYNTIFRSQPIRKIYKIYFFFNAIIYLYISSGNPERRPFFCDLFCKARIAFKSHALYFVCLIKLYGANTKQCPCCRLTGLGEFLPH
jgi:hypothetical protein